MRILYVVHQFYPESSAGTERFLFNLARAMQRSGHHVEVVTYAMERLDGFRACGSLLQKNYVYRQLPVTAIRHSKVSMEINSGVSDPSMLQFARDYLSQKQYDLLHVVHPMRMATWAHTARDSGLPYVLTATDFWTICPKITLLTSYGTLCTGPEDGEACRNLCSELNQPWVRKRLAETHELLRGAAAVLAPSQFAAGLLRKQFGDVAVSVVPHGLQSRALSRIHKQYSKDDGVVFGYCGGLVPHKGVHVLIKAFRKVQTDRARLAIHGSASNSEQGYAAELRRLADGDDRISFHGHFEADELGSVLDSLDVVVVPSLWYETYSFSLNEALAWGVPVVASGLGVMLDKIKDGENGSTFRAGDEDDLARKLKLIIDDPPLLNGMRDSLQNFTFSLEEEEAYCYERIYCEVLRERGDAGTGLGGTVPVPGPGAR